MLEVEVSDGVAVITLAHGKANAMDTEFCNAVAGRLEALAGDGARAVVITGRGRIFCAGVDLQRLIAGGAGYAREFLPTLNRILMATLDFPGPVVAAINGHAIAGGCVLACAADRRVMARGAGRVGVPELQVGVPFPALALELVREVCVPGRLRELLYGGATYGAEEALALGLVDELVDADALARRALDFAHACLALPADGFRLTKAQLRAALLARLPLLDGLEGAVSASWYAEPTLAAVAAYVERTLTRKA